MNVKVFLRVPPQELENQLQYWLRSNPDITIRFVAQSEHVLGQSQFITVTVFYADAGNPSQAGNLGRETREAIDQTYREMGVRP